MEQAHKEPSPVYVTLGSLVALHKAARSLPKNPQAIRAASGDSYLSPFKAVSYTHLTLPTILLV